MYPKINFSFGAPPPPMQKPRPEVAKPASAALPEQALTSQVCTCGNTVALLP